MRRASWRAAFASEALSRNREGASFFPLRQEACLVKGPRSPPLVKCVAVNLRFVGGWNAEAENGVAVGSALNGEGSP